MMKNKFDLIIVGAGPCGVMAAIRASKRNKKVLLIDKNNDILKKLSLSGNGRCNLTNNKEFREFIKNLTNAKFLYSTIKSFDAKDIISYFNSLNISLKEEDDNRIFPKSNKAKTIVDALKSQLGNTTILLNTMVISASKDKEEFVIKTNKQTFYSSNLLLATGGVTYEKIGVGKKAYDLAKSFNHSITKLVIEECPIKTNPIFKQWQGISLNNVGIIIKENNKIYDRHSGSIIFTHFGLSGPAILNSSFTINKLSTPIIVLNLLNMEYDVAKEFIYNLINSNPKKYLKNQLSNYLPKNIVFAILDNIKILDVQNSYLNKQQIKNLILNLTRLSFDFKGFYNPEFAFLTGSGVSLKEINAKTLESKLVSNLYFGGELLDGCGHLGGYNISIALSCGNLIGNNIK